MPDIRGIELETIAGSVRPALQRYSELTNKAVTFDLDGASELTMTPDMPNAARSETSVRHLGESAGTLYVIVFDLEDGTGDEKTFMLDDDMEGDIYPLASKSVPRSKKDVHSEAHLSIAAFPALDNHLEKNNPEPIAYANYLDIVGFDENGHFAQQGHLGQDELREFVDVTHRHMDGDTSRLLSPTVTYTTGNKARGGERFGDPQAIFNARLFIQVAGFLAITPEEAPRHAKMLRTLGAVEPELNF